MTGIFKAKSVRVAVHPKKGSTLLELIIYIAVSSIVLLAVTYFAMEVLNAKTKSGAVQEVQRNGRFALARMAAEIRQASDFNAGSSVFGSNPGTLSLAMATSDLNPTVFTVTAGILTVKQGAGAVLPLTSPKVQVSEFIVENLSPDGKTKSFRLHVKLNTAGSDGYQTAYFEQAFDTTERIRKNDGYSN